MYVLALVAIAASAYFAFQIATSRKEREFVRSGRSALHYAAIQIICGNCSGDGDIPVKTFMDVHGACERCGGRSYLLASHRGAYLRGFADPNAVRASLDWGQSERRVVPFEARPKSVPPERIAV